MLLQKYGTFQKRPERSSNMERTKTKKSVPVIEEKPEPEIPDEEGVTPKHADFRNGIPQRFQRDKGGNGC
ncbi:hypothetical protein WGM54_18875 [Paenibacillus polymyxa]